MQPHYLKHAGSIVAFLLLALVMSICCILTVKQKTDNVDVELLLKDMAKSYSFFSDTYLLNQFAVKKRVENQVNRLYEDLNQPICLMVTLIGDHKDLTEAPICSKGVTLHEMMTGKNRSGTIKIQHDKKLIGKIEWVAQSRISYQLFFILFFYCLLFAASISALLWWLYYPHHLKKIEDEDGVGNDKLTAPDVFRSLYRVMGNNRRNMGLHNHWVYVQSSKGRQDLEFMNLDGSKLRLRASLSDIKVIFPKAAYINRSMMLNTALGVHRIEEERNQLVINIKGEEVRFDVDLSHRNCEILNFDPAIM